MCSATPVDSRSGQPILVSACLLGLPTRYDGTHKRVQAVFDYLKREGLQPVPFCPEQLAGMTTPRQKSFFIHGTGKDVLEGCGLVVSASHENMNQTFISGAKLSLKLGRMCHCQHALLKDRSPSCGVHQVYCRDQIVPGSGVTTALLRQKGFTVFSENDL